MRQVLTAISVTALALATATSRPDQPKVLIADKMDARAAAIFRDRGIMVDEKPGLAPGELHAIIGNYDGLAVRSSTRVDAVVMDAALPRLKVIGRAGIGVDTIDVPAAWSSEVPRVGPLTLRTQPVPNCIASVLPRLPDELEYRIASVALVLLDTHANMVVDVLHGAVPAPQ